MKFKLLRSIVFLLVLRVASDDPSAVLWGATYHVTVKGAAADVNELPVVTQISAPLAAGTYRLQPPSDAPAIPVVVFDDHGKRFLGFALDRLHGGDVSAYTLEMGKPSNLADNQGVSLIPDHGNLRVEIDGRRLTEYRVDVGNKPFFFPLIGPTGESFTRAYPMATVAGEERDHDHPHQRSCWLTHGKVDGVDFWSESHAAGTIKETERAVIVQGPVLARLWTRNDWIAPDGRRVCGDERRITFYRTTTARIVDFDFLIRADSHPVVFGETKEGMFGLRVAPSMDVTKKKGGKITNAEGLTDETAWGQASPWVDYSGPVAGTIVGIAILNHPDSFRYPTNWHVRPYGLFAANPFGGRDFGKPDRGEYTIPPGESITFRYRVILHAGTTAEAAIPPQFRAYSQPPTLELTAD
jgi:hypothetical protein